MIILRPEPDDVNDWMDALDEYMDPSVDRLELLRERSAPAESGCSNAADGGADDKSKDCLFVEDFDAGGTSCT